MSNETSMAESGEIEAMAMDVVESVESEDLGKDKEEKMGSDDEEDEDESENETEKEQELVNLETQTKENPYMYDTHVKLITLLREVGELDRLRSARENMSQVFPLNEELWLAWLKDERNISTDSKEDRDKVERLFERAVKDYLSVPVWLEYVQFSIGGMGSESGVDKVRQVFERALTAVGLHVTQGANIWEAYREFEGAVLAGLMPKPGSVATKEQEDKFNQQNQRVISLFKRQLSISLNDIQETFAEYKQWMSDIEVDNQTKTAYEKAVTRLVKLKQYEDALLSAEAPRLESYLSYIDYEVSQDDPARIQCIFERALQENCLNIDLWLKYTKYLDRKLKVRTVLLSVYGRSVRNCPWSAPLWHNYLLAMERYHEPADKIKATIDLALVSGFTQASDFLLLWTTYCDYLRRQIHWQSDDKKELDDFRKSIERAIDHLTEYYGTDGDPTCSLRQFWAFIEARFCKNMEKVRELWNSIMAEGHGNEAHMWLEYIRLERTYGDSKHCRKILLRALNSASDWPESIVDAYLNYEREEGTLETYDQAVVKCEAQMERVQERRTKAAEKESLVEDQKKQEKTDQKGKKKGEKGQSNESTNHHKPATVSPPKHKSESWSRQQAQKARNKQPTVTTTTESTEVRPYKRKVGGSGDGAEFKVPTSRPPTTDTARLTGEPPPKKAKDSEDTPRPSVSHDPSKEGRTVFVSNLLYSIDESSLQDIFIKCGEISEVRMPKNFKGKSKGYGYVEFTNEFSVSAALQKDRQSVEGRPMYVSPCIDKAKQPSQFRFSTGLEKNKLFVKGLPFTCTKRALETIFGQHGKLKFARLVTHKSGASKGLAYIEFENETEASRAVLKTDGLQIGEHTISVSISNPPDRKTPLKNREDSFVPSLGSGKMETEIRGKARTQVSLVPRAVRKPQTTGANIHTEKSTSNNREEPSNGSSNEKTENAKVEMSNDDFRNMLLKK